MTAAENIAAVRENVAHIARGCRSGLSHNPAVHEQAVAAALDALAADLEASERETASLGKALKRANFHLNAYGLSVARHATEARVETLTRERDEWKAKYEAHVEAQPSDVEFYGR